MVPLHALLRHASLFAASTVAFASDPEDATRSWSGFEFAVCDRGDPLQRFQLDMAAGGGGNVVDRATRRCLTVRILTPSHM